MRWVDYLLRDLDPFRGRFTLYTACIHGLKTWLWNIETNYKKKNEIGKVIAEAETYLLDQGKDVFWGNEVFLNMKKIYLHTLFISV